jgi:hypothetical protein
MLYEVASRRQAHFSGCPTGVFLQTLPCSSDAGFHMRLPMIRTLANLPYLLWRA